MFLNNQITGGETDANEPKGNWNMSSPRRYEKTRNILHVLKRYFYGGYTFNATCGPDLYFI